MSVTLVPVTEAKQRFTELVKRAQESFDRYVVTKNGKEAAIVMSVDEYEGLLETIDVLSNKKELKALAEGAGQSRKGQTVSLESYRSQKESGGKKRKGR
ncbi:MAG: type II toxin-antitoxin system Phd/YefM family antitoxin [Bacteroidota bacterium]